VDFCWIWDDWSTTVSGIHSKSKLSSNMFSGKIKLFSLIREKIKDRCQLVVTVLLAHLSEKLVGGFCMFIVISVETFLNSWVGKTSTYHKVHLQRLRWQSKNAPIVKLTLHWSCYIYLVNQMYFLLFFLTFTSKKTQPNKGISEI
jgi:hypothetical protein